MSVWSVLLVISSLLILFDCSHAKYNDIRCRCTCKELISRSIPRKQYVTESTQDYCNCVGSVLPQINQSVLAEETGAVLKQYCLGCHCVYEVRSTKTMEVVVVLYLILIGILLLYMGVVSTSYAVQRYKKMSQHNTEHQQLVDEYPSTSREVQRSKRTKITSGTMVMQRLNSAQDEWKKQVENQRDKVFGSRNILQ